MLFFGNHQPKWLCLGSINHRMTFLVESMKKNPLCGTFCHFMPLCATLRHFALFSHTQNEIQEINLRLRYFTNSKNVIFWRELGFCTRKWRSKNVQTVQVLKVNTKPVFKTVLLKIILWRLQFLHSNWLKIDEKCVTELK